MPALSVSDSRLVRSVSWQGVPAWRVDLELDPAAHPGMEDVRHVWYVACMREGYLVLSVKGTAEKMRAERERIERAIGSVRFE